MSLPSKMTSNTEKGPQQTLQSVEGHARSDADAALEMLREQGSQTEILNPEKHRQLVRRIDLHIMPLICIVYCELALTKGSIRKHLTFTNTLSSSSISRQDCHFLCKRHRHQRVRSPPRQ